MVKNKPTIICLTPIRNDAWVLDRFLKATSLWADHIIIADQMSTDGSREIALKYIKVQLVDNKSVVYNELGRKRLLIDEARKISGPKLLITLDADEMFSPEIFTSGEWDEILKLTPGTAINFQWSNFSPDGKTIWKGYHFPWGYMDDGFEDYDKGIPETAIHCSRVPITIETPRYDVKSFSVIHFQFTDWDRMKHKHYYYQCLEVVNNPSKNPFDIYRQYHHMDIIADNDLIEIPSYWVDAYKENGINILEVKKDAIYWYDYEVVKILKQHGASKFKKIAIWDVDWVKISRDNRFRDPRSLVDKLIQKWLKFSQSKLKNKQMRRIDRVIKGFTKS